MKATRQLIDVLVNKVRDSLPSAYMVEIFTSLLEAMAECSNARIKELVIAARHEDDQTISNLRVEITDLNRELSIAHDKVEHLRNMAEDPVILKVSPSFYQCTIVTKTSEDAEHRILCYEQRWMRPDKMNEILQHLKRGGLIPAIKAFRILTGEGLLNSKLTMEQCEPFCSHYKPDPRYGITGGPPAKAASQGDTTEQKECWAERSLVEKILNILNRTHGNGMATENLRDIANMIVDTIHDHQKESIQQHGKDSNNPR